MSTVNLYDVLNVSNDCTQKELKSTYRELVLEFHPDQPGGDSEMFELVTHAYNVLKNPKTRAEYDELFKLSKQSENDHFGLKNQADLYLKAQGTSVTKKSKEEQEKDFAKAMSEMDRKRRYNRNTDDITIKIKEANKMYRDLEDVRIQEDIENTHDKIFEDGHFDINKFNEAFDKIHKGPMDMIPHSGNPDAWNTINGFESNFSNIDNYDNMFLDDEKASEGTIYSSVDFNKGEKSKLTKDDVSKLQGANYTSNHNFIDNNYEKMMEERLKERDQQSTKYDDRDYGDFDTNPTCGGYGIFSNIGLTNMNNLTWDNDNNDIQKRYQRLLELRKKI